MTAADGSCSAADHVLPFQIENVGVRGRLVRLGPAVEAIVRPHAYPPPIATIVAEAVALSVVLASSLKYDGVFSLQLQGQGPVRLVVADVTSGGELRACARFDSDALGGFGLGEVPLPRLFGTGVMAFTVDQGPSTERYQGVTALEGASLGDCAHAYFRQSEQLDTALHLCTTDFTRGAEPPRAAALMLQRLPPSSAADPFAEDDWRRAVLLMSSATPRELLAPAPPSAQLLYRLFHEDGVRVYRQRALRHRCRCSPERVRRTLSAFPLDELAEMAETTEPGLIVVVCEFCKARYELTLGELAGDTDGDG
ncbi:MAG: Hsp33 family molecular chaperone HslO [Rhodospirillales bacterium]|jgi:molecular chaperone Hsp33|nr:Hsp33 family molecular chaperone HslO [Rhodospirillales bacterium]